ncbi:MAG: cysteine desulfurase NifS [Candidatus Berkelbacteria bacterium]|nr:cysteine desulfurase NifS [Candidatus Berkelbacteria bacterium]
MKVYLDYAATAPTKKEVFLAMEPYFKASFGNPSSIHECGQSARKAVDNAREKIAKFLNCQTSEIVFTGCGSEADNQAITGLISGLRTVGKPHIITSAIEHHAVIKTCQDLVKRGMATVIYLKPNRDGIIEPQKVKSAINSDTVLVTIMYVNNEIGTIQPIREIGKMLEKINQNRKQRIYFHTDAVQAAEYLPVDVNYLHVDLLTLAGHKIGAPKGIGLLYIRKGTILRSIIHGGEQEMGLRAGTENVPYIVGLGKAIELIDKEQISVEKVYKLRDYFIDQIIKKIPEVYLNGSRDIRAPHIANFYFKDIEGESIVLSMDLEGVACSTGSACTSQSLEPSRVIMSIYNNAWRSAGSVRFSLSKNTTQRELDFAITKLTKVVERLRQISPYYNKE